MKRFKSQYIASANLSVGLFAILCFLLQASIAFATAPTVSDVSASTTNGSYTTGVLIHITITFDQTVTITGTPQLALANTGVAAYASGSGSNTITLNYTVGSGEDIADLDYSSTSALTLNGGRIRNGSLEDAVLTLATPGATHSLGANKDIVIDTVTSAPTFTSPATSSSARNVPISYVFPETQFSASLTLVDADMNSYQMSLASSSAAQLVSFTYDPHTDPHTYVGNVSDATFTSLPDGVYSATLAYQDSLGNPTAQVTHTSITVDTVTQSPTLTLPTSSTVVRNISVSYLLPETQEDSSVKVKFTNTNTAAVSTITRTSSTANQTVSFTYDPTTSPLSVNGVAAADFPSLADGVYDVSISYKDFLGNNTVAATSTSVTVDHTPPVISRVGSATIDVAQLDSYVDPGATATDARQGNLTSSIIVTNPVDTNTPGSYTVRYNVADSVLNQATEVTRTVNVLASTPTPTPTVTATPTFTATPTATPTLTATPTSAPTATAIATSTATIAPIAGDLRGGVAPATKNILIYVFNLGTGGNAKGDAEGSCLTAVDGSFRCPVSAAARYIVEPQNDGYVFSPLMAILPSGVENPSIGASRSLTLKSGCTAKDRSSLIQKINTGDKSLLTYGKASAAKLLLLAPKITSSSKRAKTIANINAALAKAISAYSRAIVASEALPENIISCSKSANCKSRSLATKLSQLKTQGRNLRALITTLIEESNKIPNTAQLRNQLRARGSSLLSALLKSIAQFPTVNKSC